MPEDGVVTKRPLFDGRVLVLLAIVLFSLSLRAAITSLTPLLSRISGDLNFGTTITGAFGMLPTVMFALAGFVAPALGRRIGLEKLTLFAAAATTIGTAGRGAVSNVIGLLVLMALALAGMGIGNIAIPPLIKRYFGDRIGMMSTVYVCCVQIGTIVPAALVIPIADGHGWRTSLAVWALIPFATLWPWFAISRSSRSTDNGDEEMQASEGAGPVWRSPVTWGLTVMFAMTALITYAMLTWIPQIITTAGGSERLGGLMVAVFSLSGLAAAFVTPALCARLANPYPVVIACAVCYLVGFAGLRWFPLTGTVFWMLIVGLGPSTFPAAITLINLRSRTGAGSAALSGFVQGVGYLVASAGPLVFGLLYELSGHWTLPFEFLLVAVVALLIGSYQACRPRYFEDTVR